jgi:hypothetical protein
MPCFTLERSPYLIFEAANFVSHVVNVYDSISKPAAAIIRLFLTMRPLFANCPN